MKLIVGLGNPGSNYEKTRHNAGFMVIDRLVRRHLDPGSLPKSRFASVCFEVLIAGERCMLLKPTTFMNLSGKAVAEAAAFYKLSPVSDLLVLVDDVSLPTGTIRVRAAGSAGGHNGLTDIQRALSSETYPRLRIGIDACPAMMKLEDYVLGRFTQEQLVVLESAIDRAADTVRTFVEKGITAAMNVGNAGPPSPPAQSPARAPAPRPPLPSGPSRTLPTLPPQSPPATSSPGA